MDLGLMDRVAVVMAASRGLGFGSAMALAQEGCNIAICSRKQAAVDRAADQIRGQTGRRVLGRSVDVTDPREIEAFAQAVAAEYGHVDILLNNSGGPQPGSFDTLAEADFAKAAELLLFNVVRTTKAFLPLIRKSGRGGRILTITSTSFREVIPNLMLSNSLRGAVTGWSKSLARELAPEKIAVNCVAPGSIATERMHELFAANAQKTGKSVEQLMQESMTKLPMGRQGTPAEFGAAVAFLASDKASYISGITLYVDGAATSTVL
jgi:3-oxoacyl-[acyl-carrier protein] reductase